MDYLTIKPATLKGIGLYRNNETGGEFSIWKFKRLNGSFCYETADGKRHATLNDALAASNTDRFCL